MCSAPKIIMDWGLPILRPPPIAPCAASVVSEFLGEPNFRTRAPRVELRGVQKLHTFMGIWWDGLCNDKTRVFGFNKDRGLAQNYQMWIATLMIDTGLVHYFRTIETNQQVHMKPKKQPPFLLILKQVFGVPCYFHPRSGWKSIGIWNLQNLLTGTQSSR